MSRPPARLALALSLFAAALAATGAGTVAAQAEPITEINGSTPITVVPLKNAAMIEKTKWGLRYTAGQQNSRLTVSVDNGFVRFVDTGTQDLRKRPKSCTEQSVSQGIAVRCRIPAAFANADEMFLEIWPRLGDDYVNGSTLPAKFRMWVLGDRGDDTFIGGAGDDFFNGAQDDDTAYGGAGDDWIRTGIGNDRMWGDAGNDKLVGVDGADELHGGAGNDGVYGGNGNDRLWADSGKDNVQCAGGSDRAIADRDDRTNGCEALSRS